MTLQAAGPNVKRLIAIRLAKLAIPDGGGLLDGLNFFTDQDKRRRLFAEATEWVEQALQAVRDAPGPNPWAGTDDETVAGAVLAQFATFAPAETGYTEGRERPTARAPRRS